MRWRIWRMPLILLLCVASLSARGQRTADSVVAIIDPSPYDLFYIDSSIVVNDGYSCTTDSLAVAAILKANGWGMPIVDSSYGYIMQLKVDSISARVNGRMVKLNLEGVLWFLQCAAFGGKSYPPTYLPSDIGKLTALQGLYISGNALDSLPSEIGNLTYLINLRCCSNRLTKLPASIGNLNKLVSLSLIGNQLTELPSSIGNLTNMVGLALRDNSLGRLPAEIGNLTQLVDLSLSRNQLETLPPEIGKCRELDYLEIDAAGLGSLPNEIADCTKLSSFLIDRNQLSALPDSIVKLRCWTNVDSNLLCSSVPCPVQNWLDASAGKNWPQKQRCSSLSLPSCGANLRDARMTTSHGRGRNGVTRVFDLKGRFICSVNSWHARYALRSGSYVIADAAEHHPIRKVVLP